MSTLTRTIRVPVTDNRYDYLLTSIIRQIAENPENFRDKLKDKQLYDALYWLKNTVVGTYASSSKLSRIGWDIGSLNIMYKRSPYGIQLVLTDPVA